MRTLLLAAALAAPTAALEAPGAVTAVGADARVVAFASGCTVRLWRPPARRATRFSPVSPCAATSTGSGVAQLAVAGDRALWLSFTGGNLREWSLWTATSRAPRPRRLAFVVRDVDAAAPVVVGHGDAGRLGDLLPYALGDRVVALRRNGSRAFAWSAPARVTALAANDGELAVASEGGVVTVLDSAGDVMRSEQYDGEVSSVSITGLSLLVQHGRTLVADSGTRQLPNGARLVDGDGLRALYLHRGGVFVLRTDTGATTRVARGQAAQLEGARVTVASGRRVSELRLG